MLNRIHPGVAMLLGLLLLINGLVMVLVPETWYWSVPGVPHRGPFNQHFVRDIGFIYSLMGAAFLYGAIRPERQRTLWLIPTAWLTIHAIFHIWEVLVGICPPTALVQDFAGVTIPALVSLVLIYKSSDRPESEPSA